MKYLTEHRHKNDLVHRHAQWDGQQHAHDSAAMIEAGLGNFPSGPVVELRPTVRTSASRTREFDRRDPETETTAIARVAAQIAQIIEDEGWNGSWIVAQAAHDAILQRSRILREHGNSLQSRSQSNALAYLAHLIGEAVRTARG